VNALDLFKRVVFYKGSHHASYNGTLSGQDSGVGLEEMTHPNLVCVVPVDRAMSAKMKWDTTLPWEPLLKRLREKTRGRLILTDRKEAAPKAAALKDLLPSERKQFAKQVLVSKDHVDYVL
jgi:peptide subunit release factor 1 (eRF1)